jgi:hypothetical protein
MTIIFEVRETEKERQRRRNGEKLGIASIYLGLTSPKKILIGSSISNKPYQHISKNFVKNFFIPSVNSSII